MHVASMYARDAICTYMLRARYTGDIYVGGTGTLQTPSILFRSAHTHTGVKFLNQYTCTSK